MQMNMYFVVKIKKNKTCILFCYIKGLKSFLKKKKKQKQKRNETFIGEDECKLKFKINCLFK